jgi:2,4-dienoyl-CoA reductase (NADPH2)
MLQDADRAGIEMRTATKALQITESSVKIETGSGVEEIPADTVVLAAGAESYNPLQEVLEKKGVSVQVVGDAAIPAKAFEAVHQGFAAGRRI